MSVQQFNVTSPQEMDTYITRYLTMGYTLAGRTPLETTLVKRKEFNVIWAVIGFFLCLLPLLIYCIVYATQQDEVVVLRLGPPTVDAVAWSPDRSHWWNGSAWRPVTEELPFQAPVSADGSHFWDGQAWRPVPPTAAVPQRGTGPSATNAGNWQMKPDRGSGPVPPGSGTGTAPGNGGIWAGPDSARGG